MRILPALAIASLLSSTAIPLAAEAAQCSSGWAGTIQYTRNQANSAAKTEQRVTGKGTESSNWSMTYDYAAQVSVRPAPEADYSLGRANISQNTS